MKGRGEEEIAEKILRRDVSEGSTEALRKGFTVSAISWVGVGELREAAVKNTGPECEWTYRFSQEVPPFSGG